MDAMLIWTMFCDGIMLDEKTGKVSIHGIFDWVSNRSFPFNFVAMCTARFEGPVGIKTRLACRLVDADGMSLKHYDLGSPEFKLSGEAGAVDVLAAIEATLPRPGVYRVEWLLDGAVASGFAALRVLSEEGPGR